MLVTVEADSAKSISSITVSIDEKPKVGLRVALVAGYPQEPRELLLGPPNDGGRRP